MILWNYDGLRRLGSYGNDVIYSAEYLELKELISLDFFHNNYSTTSHSVLKEKHPWTQELRSD